MDNTRILATCREIVRLLSQGRYEEIEQRTGGRRLTATEMSNAIDEYGKTLQPIPDEGLKLIDIYPLRNTPNQGWSVDVPLWSEQEGRSDLTLSLTLVDLGGGELTIEIDNLHVL